MLQAVSTWVVLLFDVILEEKVIWVTLAWDSHIEEIIKKTFDYTQPIKMFTPLTCFLCKNIPLPVGTA